MNILVIGAHPDDAEWYAGGSMICWTQQGHKVFAISVTNGQLGHHKLPPDKVAPLRKHEARESARRGGYQSMVMDFPDGELMPTIEVRKELVRLLRRLNADLVLTHRPWDYHPDHRACGTLVQDSVFLSTVPNFCPETPALRHSPICLNMMDMFHKPVPFTPHYAMDITAVMDQKWALLDAMESQVYEWLPWLDHQIESVPIGKAERNRWLIKRWDSIFRLPAFYYRKPFEPQIQAKQLPFVYVEFFEQNEYGRKPSRQEVEFLFSAIHLEHDII